MKAQNKKTIVFITEIEILFGSNNYLKHILGVTKQDKENDYIADLWYDCDHVKLYGEWGRGDCSFVKHENTKYIYIVTPSEYDFDFEDVVEWWLCGATNEIDIRNNWQDWDDVKVGVAYRGGSGYSYALYAKELKVNV